MAIPSQQQLLDENLQLEKRIAELECESRQTGLQLSELDQLYRTAPVGLCFIDNDLRFVRINDRLAVINGSTVDAHVGAHLRDMIPEIADVVEPIYQRVIETGIPELDFEVVGVTSASPNERSCLASYCPVKDDEGNVLGVSTVVQDITDRKEAEQALQESESRLRTIVDHAPEAIVVFDADTGMFVDANENAERLFGLERDALFQVGPARMSPPTQPDGFPSGEFAHARIAETLAGQVPVFEWVHRNAEGKDIPCEVRLVRLPMTGRNLLRGSVTDITERKHARDSLQRAHDELEERVQQRTAELARSVETLKVNEQLLRQLLDVQEQERRMVAYDIHDGFAQDVVGAHMHVTSIHSKLEPDKLQQRVDLAASLLSKAIAECRRMIGDLRPMVLDDEGIVEAIKHLIADERKRASLVVAFSHDVQFDRLEPKLEGVIFRIVQEALNNVKKHGQTDLAAVELKQQDGVLELVVQDQGVGFDPGMVSADRFGLRGIHERARLFGGEARIESAPGEGTTVYVQLRIVA